MVNGKCCHSFTVSLYVKAICANFKHLHSLGHITVTVSLICVHEFINVPLKGHSQPQQFYPEVQLRFL